MTILTYTHDDILKLRPEKIESKLLENMFKPLHEAGLSALLGASRTTTGSEDSATASFRKSINSHEGQFAKPKNVFQHGRIRNSSSESSQSHSHPHAMAAAPELHAIPTLAAQKEEGFQRFYKAVVSPTHVRVTAGGRIVPNTKPPPSPTPKLAREREINLEAQHHARPLGLPHNTFYPNFPSSSFAPHPIYGFGPGVMALPFANPYGTAVPGSMPTAIHGPIPANKQPAPGLSETMAQASVGSASSGPEPLANEQVDSFRFIPQGRWVSPWGPQFPYAMASMMPGAGYVPAQFMAPNMAPPPPAFYGMPTPQVQQAPIVPTRQRSNGSIHVPVSEEPVPASIPAVSPTLKAPLNPPISSIRPSQISRAHLESLRTNLRRVEDQLKYNVHQIDVPSMEQRASEIRDAIKGLEEALPSQLEFEELHYPKADTKGKSKSTSSVQPLSAPLGRKESRRVRSDSQRHLAVSRGSRSFRGTSVRNSSSESNSAKVTTLSSTMAPTAPPFKPQGLDKFTSVAGDVEPVMVVDGTDVDEPIKKTTISTTTRIPVSSSLSSASGSASVSGSSASMETVKKSIKPYLEGELLPGMDEKQAIQNGFHYRRPLTEEEIRARHLYWGRAPQSALRGLPKFDGKDFYFASPPKVRHTGRSAVGISRGWGRRSSRGGDFAKKAVYSPSVDRSEVSMDASTATSSDGTLVSCGTSQREKSEDSVFEVKQMPLAQKAGEDKQSPPKTSARVSAPVELIQSSGTGLSAPKCASPVQSSEPVHSADKSPDSKQATPTGSRDKLRRGTENLPPSGLGPHF